MQVIQLQSEKFDGASFQSTYNLKPADFFVVISATPSGTTYTLHYPNSLPPPTSVVIKYLP